MPLVRIDVIRGRDTEQVRTLLDTIHNAMVAALDVPATDRYQILTQHDPGDIVARDTGLGYPRTDDIVILQFTSRKRPEAAKADLYRRLAQSLQERCGVKATDLIVTITENGPADWSFGDGSAQFLTGAL
jgi:phenylpyruvate tautomerase PptA (4-oxalocrotonate tautomerase family)